MSTERRVGLSEVMEHLRGIRTTLDRQDVALFARTEDNEFGMPGVMTVMQRVDAHIDVLCAWARTAKKILKAAVWTAGSLGTIAGTIAAARAVGWL